MLKEIYELLGMPPMGGYYTKIKLPTYIKLSIQVNETYSAMVLKVFHRTVTRIS